MLTEEQIISNWEKFINLIGNIEGERGKKLVKFYEEYSDRFSTMPASGNEKYHNAFPGGYIDHVLNVFNNAYELYNAWTKLGAYTGDFKYSELVFAVLNHDLGKFGTETGDYYVPQNSDWHRDRGEIYKHNDSIPFMKTSDRSLFILQSLGVQISENEYMAIKLHDGLYEESNKSYLVSYSDSYRLQPHLAYILHQADLMASRIEYDRVNRTANSIKESVKEFKVPDTRKKVINTTTKKVTGKYSHLLTKK